MIPFWIQLCIVFCYGSVLGSFLGVVYTRVPSMTDRNMKAVLNGLSYPPSACPACNHRIRWYENIPVISYLVLRGKCSACQAKIPLNHFLLEVFCGIAAAIEWGCFCI